MTLTRKTRFRLKRTLRNAGIIILLGCIFSIIIGITRSNTAPPASDVILLLLVSIASYALNIYIYIRVSIDTSQGRRSTRYLLFFAASVLLLLFIPQFIISVITVGGSSLLRFLWHGIAIVLSATGFMLLTPKLIRLVYEERALPSRARLHQQRKQTDMLYFFFVITFSMLLFSIAGSSNAQHYSAGLPLLPIAVQEFSILCCCNVCSHKLLSACEQS